MTFDDLQAGLQACAGAGRPFGPSGYECPAGNALGAPPANPVCQPGINNTYTVAVADVALTTRPQFCNAAATVPAKNIEFVLTATGTAIDQNGADNGDPTLCIPTFIPVIFPCITVTKECVNPCTPIGQPIGFRGTVCNSGDSLLVAVSLSDSPTATINIATTTSTGRTYDGTLNPGECVNYTGSYSPGGSGAALCGPFTDTITATAIAPDGLPVTNTDPCISPTTGQSTGPRPPVTATCHVQTSPSITLTKDCQPRTITIGVGSQTYTETFVVCNTGDVALGNVVINDSKVGAITIGTLAPGQCVTNVQGPFTVTAADCGPVTDRATATGANGCPPDATCPAPATVTSAEQTCTVTVVCPPNIEVVKEVACYLPGDTCGTYSKLATGVKDSSCPAFCYRITVSNPGATTITALTVQDSLLGNISADFASALPLIPGESVTVEFKAIPLCQNTTNVVTANGRTAEGAEDVDTDSAVAVVLNINLECDLTLFSSFDMDDNANDNRVTLPAGSVDTSITFNLVLRNTGSSTVTVTNISGLPALVDCTDLVTPVVTALPFDIAAGGSATLEACVLVSCPPGAQFSIQAHGIASDEGGTLCVFDENGVRVSDSTDVCPAVVTCETPVTCRVTGGGVLLTNTVDQSCITVATTIFPLTTTNGLFVNKITHGGQLGAPFSHEDCGEILGNPCIRGQWQHVRHYQGKGNPRDVIDMNFHSNTPKGVFDSLNCACLGCCDPETGVFITPITVGSLCNPDDHKVCGPQPRPAPANAIIFSGIGRITPEDDVRGGRPAQAEWVIFRVYIEDRSEPGGHHPGGAVEPADIYCFQAWKTGIKVSKKPDFSTVSPDFRHALGRANCDFLEALKSGTLPIGTLPPPEVMGVTADIQDCGPMNTGNHQIHPSTSATCEQ